MDNSIHPMSLGDIFDRIFKLFTQTFVRNLIIAVIVFLPAGIMLTFALDWFFSTIAQIAAQPGMINERWAASMMAIFSAIGISSITMILVMISYLAGILGITIVGCNQMSGQTITWQEALRATFSVRLLRVFGQQFLQYLAISAIILVPYIFLIIAIASESSSLSLISGLLLLAAAITAAYFVVQWILVLPVIAWEDATVMQSFKRSATLVRDFWWRTLGIYLLINIIAQFAISIVTTPLSIFAFWGFFSRFFGSMSSFSEGQLEPEMQLEILQSLGSGIGILIALSTVLSLLIIPLIATVMYFDLRARKDELNRPEDIPIQPEQA